jgi:hypothetical protein
MSETNLMKRILMRLSSLRGVVAFRNNVGMGWSGRLIKEDRLRGTVLLGDARPVRFGLAPGSGDLIGWQTVTVTPEMVGKPVALFLSAEVKTDKGRATDQQNHFMRVVNEAGGVAGIVKSEAEAQALIEGRLL